MVSLSSLDRLLNLARTAPCDTLNGSLMDSLHGRPQDSVASSSIAAADTERSMPFMLFAWGSETCTVSVPAANSSSYSGAAWSDARAGIGAGVGAGAGAGAGTGAGAGAGAVAVAVSSSGGGSQ